MATGMRALLDTVVQALPQVKLPPLLLSHIQTPLSQRKSWPASVNTQEKGEMGGYDCCNFCWPLDDSDRRLIKDWIYVHILIVRWCRDCLIFTFQLDAFRLPIKARWMKRMLCIRFRQKSRLYPISMSLLKMCDRAYNRSMEYIK